MESLKEFECFMGLDVFPLVVHVHHSAYQLIDKYLLDGLTLAQNALTWPGRYTPFENTTRSLAPNESFRMTRSRQERSSAPGWRVRFWQRKKCVPLVAPWHGGQPSGGLNPASGSSPFSSFASALVTLAHRILLARGVQTRLVNHG